MNSLNVKLLEVADSKDPEGWFNIVEPSVQNCALSCTVFLLKKHLKENDDKMIVFSTDCIFIDAIHQLMIELSRGIDTFLLISMSKFSKQRGHITYKALAGATAIVANTHMWFKYFKTAKQNNDKYNHLTKIAGARAFNLIIFNEAYQIIPQDEFIEQFIIVWDSSEYTGRMICKSNYRDYGSAEDYQELEDIVKYNWIQYFMPGGASFPFTIQNIK